MLRNTWFLVSLTGVLALSGCGSKGAGPEAAAPSTGAAATSPAVSKYDAGPRAGESAADEEQAEAGEKLFSTKGCTACHTHGKKLTGPDLAGVSMRRTAEWMENQILHPDVMTKQDPISHQLFATFALQMPNQGLTPEQTRAVIEFLKHKDQEAGLKPAGK